MKNKGKIKDPKKMAIEEGISFIDLRYDFAFKRVFGTPGNEKLLKMLINGILPGLRVKSLTLGNQENMGDAPAAKRTIFDIKATTDEGRTIVLEMHLEEETDFNDRMVYYSTYPIREQVMKGVRSYSLTPVYIISIMDFLMDGKRTTNEVVNEFGIVNVMDSTKALTDNVTYITVELPKFNKDLGDLISLTDKIIWLLRNMGELKERPAGFYGEDFDNLFDITKFAAMDYADQIEYLREFHARLDRQSQLDTAIEKGLERGLKQGLNQGLKQGFEQGQEQGRSQGISESRRDIAGKMKNAGIDVGLIVQCTGLSEEEIRSL